MLCISHENHGVQSGLPGFIGLVPPPLRIRAYSIQFITLSLTFVLYHVNIKFLFGIPVCTHVISHQYGVLREELGFPLRATYIIGPNRKVKYVSLYPPEVGRNVAEIIRVIQGLLYEEASGLGVPAYWQPGMQGILRDFKFTGKI